MNPTDPNNPNSTQPISNVPGTASNPPPPTPTFTPAADLSSAIPNQTWPNPPQPAQLQPEPIPTFTPPQPVTEPPTPPNPFPSTPTAPEPIPTQPEPIPTFTPPQPSIPAEAVPSIPTTPDQPPIIVAEPAPTDLSHLIPTQNGAEQPIYTPPMNQPETLVTPANGNGTVSPNIPTETKSGFPKWVIGLGILLLLAVSATSAYFILGVGQPQGTTSLPAEQVQQAPAATAPIVVTTTPAAATASTNESGFGQFQNPTPTASTSSGSAADLLRSRQGR